MRAYYNENDPYAAQWLKNLIAAGHIAEGDVDDRSIEDVTPADLRGYTQCHFFAGVGVWSYALRLAGWDDARPVWTGSCPCQPFSAAGKSGGFADERHLWPAWFHLIELCKPVTVFGEQVASKDGLVWFDLVCNDLEAAGYTAGAVDLCAAGVGAPHIRQRLWFVGNAERMGRRGRGPSNEGDEPGEVERLAGLCAISGVANASGGQFPQPGRRQNQREGAATVMRVGGTAPRGLGIDGGTSGAGGHAAQPNSVSRPGPTNGYWRAVDWLYCRDDKWRPVEPGTFPLAHGAPARMGRLRAYGNAINAQAAAEFIRAAMTC